MASSSPRDAAAIAATDLSRVHRDGARALRSLDAVSLTVAVGEVVAVVGPSGSGKSTLLHLLAGLDRPDAGRVEVTGVTWDSMRGKALARFRRRTCGFVAQGASLLPAATAAENIEVPLLLDGVPAAERRDRVAEALAQVGLSGDADKLPDQLSGGQQQRVAIARALVNNPAIMLADEPTASLDSTTAIAVVDLMLGIARARHSSVVLVTHDPTVAAKADRTVTLRSGRLDVAPPAPTGG
jgi:putative ABC transport system ATP-binding protein